MDRRIIRNYQIFRWMHIYYLLLGVELVHRWLLVA
jgi:hypothetical protein